MTWKQLTGVATLAVAACVWPSVVRAQHTCPTCRTATGPTCTDKDCGLCGLKQSPTFDKRYIRQFCRPTICPSSCFGHFKTQWTPWPVACPNWSVGNIEYTGLNWGPPPHPSYVPPGGARSDATRPSEIPLPRSSDGESDPAKKPMPEPPVAPKASEKAPLPASPIPKVDPPKLPDGGGRPGTSLPPVPELPVNVPTPLPEPPPLSPVKY